MSPPRAAAPASHVLGNTAWRCYLRRRFAGLLWRSCWALGAIPWPLSGRRPRPTVEGRCAFPVWIGWRDRLQQQLAARALALGSGDA